MTTVLVTGASGFLGSRVVAKLRDRGCEVTTLARSSGDLLVDLVDDAAAERALTPWRWDVCIHLAAPVTVAADDFMAHSRIALHVARAARGRLVHASSMVVYGLPQQLPVTEDHPRDPMQLYGRGKVLAEDIVLRAEHDVPVSVLRFGGLFSEQRRNGALFHFCRAARAGELLRVTTPTPTPWELLHVDDAAEGLVQAALHSDPPHGAFNLGYGEPIELVAIAHRVAALAGAGSTVEVAPGVAHPVFQLDIARARLHLGWNPPSLDRRLAGMLEAFT